MQNMVEEKKQQIQSVNKQVDLGEAGFFAHECNISINPHQFVLDFKNIVPRYSDKVPVIKEIHKTILLDPVHFKEIIELSSKLLKGYEEKYGEIKKNDAILQAEKESQNILKKIQKPQETSSTGSRAYLG